MEWQPIKTAPDGDINPAFVCGQYDDGDWWFSTAMRFDGVWYEQNSAIELNPKFFFTPEPPSCS